MSAVSPVLAFAPQRPAAGGARSNTPDIGLKLAQILNKTKYSDLPPKAIEHAKIIIASTLASAAYGSHGLGSHHPRVWPRTTAASPSRRSGSTERRLPCQRGDACQRLSSDAAASDDSDMRNTAHIGTSLAVGRPGDGRTHGRDRPGPARAPWCRATRRRAGSGEDSSAEHAGVHASQTVAFSGVVACGKLLKLTDEQMATRMGIVGDHDGRHRRSAPTAGRASTWAETRRFCARQRRPGGRPRIQGQPRHPRRPGRLRRRSSAAARKPIRAIRPARRTRTGTSPILRRQARARRPPVSSIVEAAINAVAAGQRARRTQMAKILVAGPGPTVRRAALRPEGLGRGHPQPAVLRRLAPSPTRTSPGSMPPRRRSTARSLRGSCTSSRPIRRRRSQLRLGLGRHGHDRHEVRRPLTSTVDAPRGSAPRGIEWSDIDAKYRALMPESKLAASASRIP